MNVNPSRLKFARMRRGWTKAWLANELGVQVRSVQAYESGEYAPDPERFARLCELLQFPDGFFSGDDLPVIDEHTASFRSMSKMSATLKRTALGTGTTAFLLNDWIEERFRLPEADLPDLSDLSPEEAAATLRRMWGLGEAPVGNFLHLLELRGIRVYSLAIEAREVDAFSVWYKGRPFVFLNTQKSAEHSRFDAAHELGHLVRDRHSMEHGDAHKPEMEREANAFASAFLMPAHSVTAHKSEVVTIGKLIDLKRIWGVSLAALAYRMNHLGLFSEWTYRNLCIQIAKHGYRKTEPNPITPESSQVLRKVFDTLRSEGISRTDVARELCLVKQDIDNLTFGLTVSGVASPPRPEGRTTGRGSSSPKLRLFK